MKVKARLLVALVSLSCCLTAFSYARAQGMVVIPGAARATLHVKSLEETRQARIVRQRWDMSCGSAALSTLLTYSLHDPTPETAIIVWILHRTSPVKIQSRGGFSLFDLKRYAVAHGFDAEGYAGLKLKDLEDLGRPAIIPVRVETYNHFVVYRGVVGNRVLVGDPSFGNLTMTAGHFETIWKNGIAFYVFPMGSKLSPEKLEPRLSEFLVPEGGVVYRDAFDHPALQPTR